jgi:hypothetical protein
MVVGVGFCKIKVDSNFLLVLKIKCTKFHQDRSKTVDLHTKYTNKQTFSFIYRVSILKVEQRQLTLCIQFIGIMLLFLYITHSRINNNKVINILKAVFIITFLIKKKQRN